MSLERWIFRFRGEPVQEEAESLVRLFDRHHIKIADDSLPKMALVEATPEKIKAISEEISSCWRIVEEKSSYPIPDTRKKLKS